MYCMTDFGKQSSVNAVFTHIYNMTTILKTVIVCWYLLFLLGPFIVAIVHWRIVTPPPSLTTLSEKYYFTTYQYVEKQTDKSPCYGALSKANLCELAKDNYTYPMALTADIRKRHNIKPWDRVELVWDEWCAGVYTVLDDMNKRFRQWCIKRDWVCIKWDLSNRPWGKCHLVINKDQW